MWIWCVCRLVRFMHAAACRVSEVIIAACRVSEVIMGRCLHMYICLMLLEMCVCVCVCVCVQKGVYM